MSAPPPPGTDWQERVAPGEAERYARHAEDIVRIQALKAKRHGNGRTLHRKQLAAAQGTLSVLDGLPAWARHGLFAEPRDYEAWVRLSNGALDRQPDRVPDIRGFAIRVLGVQGASALGEGQARSQDFTLINQEAFAFPGSEEFVDFVGAAAKGNGELVRHIFRRYGLAGGAKRLANFAKVVGRRFTGFATEPLHSALPMANGPYAVRVRLVPAPGNGKPDPKAKNDFGADFAARLAKAPLHWDLQLQYYANEALTPIEDASVNWPTPYTTVARLMLPQQDLGAADAKTLAERTEAGVFDPWQALAAHRPLGDVQRARKVIYFASQKGRGAV